MTLFAPPAPHRLSRRKKVPRSSLWRPGPAARAALACALLAGSAAARAAHQEEDPAGGSPGDAGSAPAVPHSDGPELPHSDGPEPRPSDSPEAPPAESAALPARASAEPRPPAARPRTQAFLLPLEAAARSAAERVGRGATGAILGSPGYEMADLAPDLGARGAPALNPLVEGAVAEVSRGEFGESLRELSARFSLARVLVGAVALDGGTVEVRLALADAPRARLLGAETLRFPAPASGADPIEGRTRDAVRRLLLLAAPDPALARPGRSWKRGLFDKTGTEGWDLSGDR